MYRYVLTILFFACMVSCKPDAGKKVEEIKLHHSVVLDEDKLMLGKVKDIAWANDSVLVIVDSNPDGFLHFVHLSGTKEVSTYGMIGQGPDEFLLVGSVCPDADSHLTLFDVNRQECSIQEIGEEGMSFRSLFHSGDSLFHLDILPLSGNRYVAMGLYKHYRFYLLDANGKAVSGFGEYPYRDKKEKQVDGLVRSEIYQGRLAVGPHRDRLVQAMYKAKILSFYEQSDEGWACIKEHQESFPEYNYNAPALDAGTPVGYLDVCTDESQVYALYSGKNYRDHKDAAFLGHTVEVYRWDGTLVKRYVSDISLKAIEITDDGACLYAVAYNPDPVLVRFPLMGG